MAKKNDGTAPDEQDHTDGDVAVTEETAPQSSGPSRSSSARSGGLMTNKQKGEAIRQVDSTERKIGYLGAALVVVLALGGCLPYVLNPHRGIKETAAPKGHSCPSGYKYTLVSGAHECVKYVYQSRGTWILEMCIVLVFGVFVALATIYGRRSLLAFALLLSGLAITQTTGNIAGLAFLVAGGWLLVRAYRVQKYGTTNAKEVAQLAAQSREERRGGSSARSTKSPKSASAPASRSGKKKAESAPRVEANKRYTPKAPPRRRPPAPKDPSPT